MSGSLFPDYDEYMAERAAQSAQSYEVRMLKKLYEAISTIEQFNEDERAAGDEFGFRWFSMSRGILIELYAEKVPDVSPAAMLRSQGMTKTKLWRTYFEVKANHMKYAYVGLIFPVPRMSQFIMHNMVALAPTPGANRIVRAATNPDKGLIIEPYNAFLAALAGSM